MSNNNNFSFDFSTIVHAAQSWAKESPYKIAFSFIKGNEREEITYQELDIRAKSIAGTLHSIAGHSPERAMLFFNPGIDYVCAFLGCLYAGVIAVPAYPPRNNHHMNRLQKIIDDAQAMFVLSTKDMEDKLKDLPQKIIYLDNLPTSIYQEKTISPESLAFLQYTSGSTDDPKGVMISHHNLVNNIERMGMVLGEEYSEHDVLVTWLPPYHDMGLMGGILAPLFHEVKSVILTPTAFLQNPLLWLETITKEKATITASPNFAFDLCVETITPEEMASLDLSSLKAVINGAEPIRYESVERFCKKFESSGFRESAMRPSYGLAECTVMVSSGHYEKIAVDPEHLLQGVILAPQKGKKSSYLVSCGPVIPEHEAIIVDPQTCALCEPTHVGEIWVAGESVAQGYWQKPKATKESFKAKLKDNTSNKTYLRTGDLGWLDDKGHLYITGRIKDVIILGGKNFYPQDLEKTASSSNASLINNAAVAFTYDDVAGGLSQQRLVIIQEVKRHTKDFPSIFEVIQQALWEEHQVVAQDIILIQRMTLPKTSSGKVQRRLTKAMFLENSLNIVSKWQAPKLRAPSEIKKDSAKKNLDQKFSPSKDVIENWIKEWITSHFVLDNAEIDATQPFVIYGFTSLLATELCAELGIWLNIHLNPVVMFEQTSPQALASYIVNAWSELSQESQITPSQKAVGQNPCMLLHGLGGTRFEMEIIKDRLKKSFTHVHSNLLEGHETCLEDLEKITAEGMIKGCESDLDALFRAHGPVHLSGLCIGSVVALRLAQLHPEKVKSLALVSTSLFLDGFNVSWAMKMFAPLCALLPNVLGRHIRLKEKEPYGIKSDTIREQMKAIMTNAQNHGYTQLSFPVLKEAQRLSRIVQRDMAKVNAATIIIHATEDDLSSIKNATYIRDHIKSSVVETVLLNESYHMATLDQERDRVAKVIHDFFIKSEEF